MVEQVRRCSVTDTILKSVIRSYREYVRICDFTMGVYETPEYWYTTGITRSLAKTYTDENIYPVLEDAMSSISSYRKQGHYGRLPKKLRTGGRTDIALWRYKYSQDDWEPISVLEVKRGWGWGGDPFRKDIDRILTAIEKLGKKNKSGTLESGFFIIVSDYWDESRADIMKKFQKDFDKTKFEIGEIIGKHHKFNGYIEHSEYNKDHKTMGAAMVFKFK